LLRRWVRVGEGEGMVGMWGWGRALGTGGIGALLRGIGEEEVGMERRVAAG